MVIPSLIEYAELEEKLDLLRTVLKEERDASDSILERVSLAFGCAVFDRLRDHSYQEVFERADKIMYEEKKKLHEIDGITTDR